MIDYPQKEEFNPYYDRYISLLKGQDVLVQLELQIDQMKQLLTSVSEKDWTYRYAPDKWTLKEVIGHIIDNERIMAYRMMCIAYGEQKSLPGYDQDDYMSQDPYAHCTPQELLEEYITVRRATLALLKRLPARFLARIGNANQSDTSARALAYIIAGHELHHMRIIQERYLQPN
ncbi:DinB family protein [Paenibacillus protaetiae]|uniref:DinB family protein n=1 Tax=Paenibacillus protaetiae TaxID=2509456 RepID=A0A4P6EXB7_9BACL|nr:DinB family protein [Paenibacillus protaetiae]QAY67396.1 DinB family protein [Paenibacillus protaetiae]